MHTTNTHSNLRRSDAVWRHSHLRWSNRLHRHHLRRSDALWRSSHLWTDLRTDLWSRGCQLWANHLWWTNTLRGYSHVHSAADDLRTFDHMWWHHRLRRSSHVWANNVWANYLRAGGL